MKIVLIRSKQKPKYVPGYSCTFYTFLILGDRYIVCAGYDSNRLLKSIGLRCPLVPIKAYSLHIANLAIATKWKYAVHIQVFTVFFLFNHLHMWLI